MNPVYFYRYSYISGYLKPGYNYFRAYSTVVNRGDVLMLFQKSAWFPAMIAVDTTGSADTSDYNVVFNQTLNNDSLSYGSWQRANFSNYYLTKLYKNANWRLMVRALARDE
mgnify:CR=1 FL=1